MSTHPTAIFRSRLAELPLDTDADKIAYILLAARLACLPAGDGLSFLFWSELAEEMEGRFAAQLRSRISEGMWTLDNRTGRELGAAVADAQDFHLFRHIARTYDEQRYREHVPEDVDASIVEWARHTATAPLDEAAAEHLVKWLATYPVREELRLQAVATPLSDEMTDIIGDVMKTNME